MNLDKEKSLDLLDIFNKVENFIKFLDKENKDASAELKK